MKAKDIGLSLTNVLLAYLAYNACYTLASYPIGKLSDKIRMEYLLSAGLLIYAVVYWGMASENKWFAFPLFIVYGLFAALTEGVIRALIANVVIQQT